MRDIQQEIQKKPRYVIITERQIRLTSSFWPVIKSSIRNISMRSGPSCAAD